MNRFEVLRGFNKFLMCVFAFFTAITALIAIVTFDWIPTILFMIYISITAGLYLTLEPLLLRIHQEYFPRNAVIVPSEIHKLFIGDPKYTSREAPKFTGEGIETGKPRPDNSKSEDASALGTNAQGVKVEKKPIRVSGNIKKSYWSEKVE